MGMIRISRFSTMNMFHLRKEENQFVLGKNSCTKVQKRKVRLWELTYVATKWKNQDSEPLKSSFPKPQPSHLDPYACADTRLINVQIEIRLLGKTKIKIIANQDGYG